MQPTRRGIDERMGGEKPADAVDDLFGDDRPPVVDVEGRKFLSVSDRSTRLEDVDDISLGGIIRFRIAASEIPGDGSCSTVIVDDQGIFLGRIEIRRIKNKTVDFGPFAVLESPGFDFPRLELGDVDPGGNRQRGHFLFPEIQKIGEGHLRRDSIRSGPPPALSEATSICSMRSTAVSTLANDFVAGKYS